MKRLDSDKEHIKGFFQISKAHVYRMIIDVAEQAVYAVLFTHLTKRASPGASSALNQ